MTSPDSSRRDLIDLLQRAHSGELAAAHAYIGHAASVRDPVEREEIAKIESDEWEHRECVAEMLRDLGESASPWLELDNLFSPRRDFMTPNSCVFGGSPTLSRGLNPLRPRRHE